MTTRSGRRVLLLVCLLIVGYEVICLFSLNDSPLTVVKAAPVVQNSNAECPPHSDRIWVRVDTNEFPGEPARSVHIPFESGAIEIDGHTYVNYLLGVLLHEIGPTPDFDPVDEETIKAQAILARTVAYKNCGIVVGNHRGIDDSDKQQYNPVRGED